jgi:hypothetical protein
MMRSIFRLLVGDGDNFVGVNEKVQKNGDADEMDGV